MLRMRFCFVGLLIVLASDLWVARGQVVEGPMRIVESKSVTVNDATFAVIAQAEWQPGKPWTDKRVNIVAPIDIQLRITNVSKNEVMFPTFNSFGLKLLTADGKEVKSRGKKGTAVTGPVSLPSGASYSLWRQAHLRLNEEINVAELSYFDGTGSESIFGPLVPGRYKLLFWYSVPRDTRAKLNSVNATSWSGEVITHDAAIEILPGTTRGRGPENERFAGPVNFVRKMRQSNPVTKNNAVFVVTAEGEWNSGNDNIPVEVQLRIMNLSNEDRIFNTFDAFGLRMTRSDGTTVGASGGRLRTFVTRGVVIPKGASYSLCRKAELGRTSEPTTRKLTYWDGSNSEHRFGPLSSGKYKLGFWYGAIQNPQLSADTIGGNKNDPRMWYGNIITDDVLIEYLDREQPNR